MYINLAMIDMVPTNTAAILSILKIQVRRLLMSDKDTIFLIGSYAFA